MKNDLELANLPSKLAIHLEIVSVNLFSRTPFPQLFFPCVFLPSCHFTPFLRLFLQPWKCTNLLEITHRVTKYAIYRGNPCDLRLNYCRKAEMTGGQVARQIERN